MSPPETRAGRAAAAISRGEGARPALLLHCTLASGRSLVPLMERLGDRLSMTAIDLPGHGRSDPWNGEGDYLAQATDAAEHFCGTGRMLIGHSFGAVVALALMTRRPDLVRGAVLIEPVLFAAAAGTEAFEDHRRQHGVIREALAAGERERATQLFTGAWGTGQDWAAIPAPQRRAMVERIHLVEASAPGLSEDSTGILGPGRLDRVAAPVLLLRGSESPPVVPEIARTLLRRLPDAREEVLPGAGHMAPLTHPDAVAARIRDHLGRSGV